MVVPLVCLALGALVGRYWILLLPALTVALYLVAIYPQDPTCGAHCGEEDTWATAALAWTMSFVPLPTVALLAGVMARRARHGLR